MKSNEQSGGIFLIGLAAGEEALENVSQRLNFFRRGPCVL